MESFTEMMSKVLYGDRTSAIDAINHIVIFIKDGSLVEEENAQNNYLIWLKNNKEQDKIDKMRNNIHPILNLNIKD